jgi:hypothetical protein
MDQSISIGGPWVGSRPQLNLFFCGLFYEAPVSEMYDIKW